MTTDTKDIEAKIEELRQFICFEKAIKKPKIEDCIRNRNRLQELLQLREFVDIVGIVKTHTVKSIGELIIKAQLLKATSQPCKDAKGEKG